MLGNKKSNEDIFPFLITQKLIFGHGLLHSKNNSKMDSLFAVHHSHYVVEQILRERAKDVIFNKALHQVGFEEIIKTVNKKMEIPFYNDLLDLNKIRNDAEHSRIIPDHDTVASYVKIAESYLRWAYDKYYNVKYESLYLEDMIFDIPIRRVMLEAKTYLDKNDLANASNKMYEALGAFKFLWFSYLSDPRVDGISFSGIDFPNLLADHAFKIILSNDENTLKKLMSISSSYQTKDEEVVGVKSIYPVPKFLSPEEALKDYNEILIIILNYQEKIPISFHRKKTSS